MFNRRAFTVLELLVCLGVTSILAAIVLPVFVQARQVAIATSCVSRFRQVASATQIYLVDYDDGFMPVNHAPAASLNPSTDRTWVQMLLPYTGSFRTFRCPADNVGLEDSVGIFDEDLLPGDLLSRYYSASMHVNAGYNFQYLAPIVRTDGGWTSEPKTLGQLADPAKMLLFIDSAWEEDNGQPVDGGSWLVSPPCRYQNTGKHVLDTISATNLENRRNRNSDPIFSPVGGWGEAPKTPTDYGVGTQYGGAWPWHLGRVTVVTVGGAARTLTIDQLSSGCDSSASWAGSITNRHQYLWSPQ
jgi:prepilin-type N-terminal cleavage/methylation domain-containing protein